jgi:hypothetical protein
MAVARPRLLTLAMGDMETLRMVPLFIFSFFLLVDTAFPATKYFICMQNRGLHSYTLYILFQEVFLIAQDWAKPPPDATFNLRVPVEYASIHAAVSFHLFLY